MLGYSACCREVMIARQEREVRRTKSSTIALFRKKLDELPEARPLPFYVGVGIFGGLSLMGLMIGAALATYIFIGIATLAGLIALVERNKYLKWLVMKSNMLLDMLLFAASVYATAVLGVTMVASLTIAGLGFTLVYAPYLRHRESLGEQQEGLLVIDIEYEEVRD